MRHIPPFPFHSVAKIVDNQYMIMKNGDNLSLDIHSLSTKKHLLKVMKKGDFCLQSFDMNNQFIVYSDCVDTQILQFDLERLNIVKLTNKICIKNGIERIPASKFIKVC